jgi:hypothetical protein
LIKSKTSGAIALITSAAFLTLILYISSTEAFPYSEITHQQMINIQPTQNIGPQMSRFLWDFRGQDLLVQSLLLFATAVCCITLLKEENTPK